MTTLLAGIYGAFALAWLWGAFTGRLPSMLAALIEPARAGQSGSWLVTSAQAAA